MTGFIDILRRIELRKCPACGQHVGVRREKPGVGYCRNCGTKLKTVVRRQIWLVLCAWVAVMGALFFAIETAKSGHLTSKALLQYASWTFLLIAYLSAAVIVRRFIVYEVAADK